MLADPAVGCQLNLQQNPKVWLRKYQPVLEPMRASSFGSLYAEWPNRAYLNLIRDVLVPALAPHDEKHTEAVAFPRSEPIRRLLIERCSDLL